MVMPLPALACAAPAAGSAHRPRNLPAHVTLSTGPFSRPCRTSHARRKSGTPIQRRRSRPGAPTIGSRTFWPSAGLCLSPHRYSFRSGRLLETPPGRLFSGLVTCCFPVRWAAGDRAPWASPTRGGRGRVRSADVGWVTPPGWASPRPDPAIPASLAWHLRVPGPEAPAPADPRPCHPPGPAHRPVGRTPGSTAYRNPSSPAPSSTWTATTS